MAEYEHAVRALLRENGCRFLRHGKGDHDIWYSPISNRNVTVDSKIKSRQYRQRDPEAKRHCLSLFLTLH